MEILIVGLGVIGSIYGYAFQKSGNKTEHFLRKNSPKAAITDLNVQMLDGRKNPKGTQIQDVYKVNHFSKKEYDFIFVSVPSGSLAEVIKNLDEAGISGTFILACGIWESRQKLDELMSGKPYILGYPVAGGNLEQTGLNSCLFDHFILEQEKNTQIKNYRQLVKLFADCQIKLEQPYDALEWIWLHMAINAAVVSVAGKYGDIKNPTASAEQPMNSPKILAEAIRAIRETSKIVASRGVKLKHYNNELLAYKLPTFISAPIMKKMFAQNILSRKIMTLHNNFNDLFYVCKTLYDSGKKEKVPAPIFYDAYEKTIEKLQE